jgi:PAS domain S-box-containing protein
MTDAQISFPANYNANIYRDVVENLKEVVFIVDRTGKFTLLNKAWAEITGFSVESSIGKYFLEFVHPDDRAENLQLFIPLMEKHKSVCSHVTRYQTQSGGFRWMKIHARLVLDENEDSNGCVGTMNDVTELKVYEDKLRDAAIVIDAAMDGIAHVDERGVFTHLNKAYLNMMGYSSEAELLGKSWKTHYSAEELAIIDAEVKPRLASHGYWSGVGRATRKDGTTFPKDLSLTIMADGGMVCICRDVTEKVNVANALRTSETRWQLAVESIRDGILDADLTNGVIHLSAGWQTLLGLEPYELVTNWSKLNRRIHPEDRTDLLDAYDNTGDGQHLPVKGMHRMMAADGNYRWIHLRGRELFDENGRPVRIVGTATDVSEQKKAEEQLLANLARERDLNEMKSHFVSMASHELRTPLATLTLGLDFLITHRKRLSEEQIEKTLATVREGNQQLISIVDDLLLLGRADEGQLRCSLAQVNLTELFTKIIQDSIITEKH